jgi:hypothetical protein
MTRLWAAAVMVTVACTAADQAPPAPAPAPAPQKVAPPRPQQLTHVTIKALGMYCEESCPLRVRMALADIKAVYELGIDPSKESIFVSYDTTLGAPKQVTRPMLAAIKQAGFDPWLASETWPDKVDAQVVRR